MPKRPKAEDNCLTPEYFMPIVAKKLNVPVGAVREVYTKYLSNLSEVMKVEKRVFIKNLGSFELDPRKCLYQLWRFAEYCEVALPEGAVTATQTQLDKYQEASRILKLLLDSAIKYEYIQESIRKIRTNNRRFDQLFDDQGECRESFILTDDYLQQLSVEKE